MLKHTKNKLFIILFLFVSKGISFSQSWTNQQLITANTAQNAPGLTTEEKNVFLYLNLARLYPSDFANIELKAYFGNRYSSSLNSYESSLKNELLTMRALHAYTFSSEMYRLAKCFSDETARNGIVGHTRIQCSSGWNSECCSYGYSSGKSIILQLLIDDGISSLGHRRSCLSSKYYSFGPSINTHPQYQNCCVIDFSTSYGINYSTSTAPIITSIDAKTTSNITSTESTCSGTSTNNSTLNTQSEITELRSQVSQLNRENYDQERTIDQLNRENTDKEKTIAQLNRENATLKNSSSLLQQQKVEKDLQYNKLHSEHQTLSDRRTTVRKSKYNADEFHALTMKIGLNTFYQSIRDMKFETIDETLLSIGAETMIGFNFGDSYRRNSIGITMRASQANRFLTNSIDSSAVQPMQFYDAELTTIIREWLSFGVGANLRTSYGSSSFVVNPSMSLGLCFGPKNWKIQITQQATMNSDMKIFGRASLGLSFRL